MSAPREKDGKFDARPPEARVWEWVDRRGPDECWPWAGTRTHQGYGKITSIEGGKRRYFRAHRVALAASLGRALDPDEIVCHRCDNPPCCNPAHLFIGTGDANVADRHLKGRDSRGARHPKARLTREQAEEVRKRYLNGESPTALGRAFGITPTAAKAIGTGINWGHLPSPLDELRAALSASQERERVLVKVLRKVNRDPTLSDPGLLTAIRAALQSPPTPAPESRQAQLIRELLATPGPVLAAVSEADLRALRRWLRDAATPAPESEPKCGPPLCSGCGVATGCGPKGCRHCERARAALSKSQEGER